MRWFNVLLSDARLAGARENIVGKLAGKVTKENGCIEMPDAKYSAGEFRPVLDKKFLDLFKSIAEDAPARISHYQVALLEDGREIVADEPPKLPEKFRKVLKRGGKDLDKGATWVASHLCHNKKCCNKQHLVWEPSWMNRMRDNCPGGDECVHRPFKCLRAHREAEELVDWTEYL